MSNIEQDNESADSWKYGNVSLPMPVFVSTTYGAQRAMLLGFLVVVLLFMWSSSTSIDKFESGISGFRMISPDSSVQKLGLSPLNRSSVELSAGIDFAVGTNAINASARDRDSVALHVRRNVSQALSMDNVIDPRKIHAYSYASDKYFLRSFIKEKQTDVDLINTPDSTSDGVWVE